MSLIMQLKSFSWAEQIFTAYFAANCFAGRKVLAGGLAGLAHSHHLQSPLPGGRTAPSRWQTSSPQEQASVQKW